MLVFLEGGAAAGGVGDDGVVIVAEKCGEILSREIACGIANSRMRCECAAAELFLGYNHFAAVGGENAKSSFVERGKSDVGDAAGEEGDAGAARTRCGKRPAITPVKEVVVDAREESFAFGEAEKFQNADAARDSLQSGALINANHTREVDDAMGIGKQVAKNKVACDGGEPGARIVALDSRAGMLDEFSILDAGGAGGFAGAAVKTFVDMVGKGIGDGLLIQLDLDHLVDTAARRIGFEVPEAVGGAGIEAQAAVDAAGIVLVDGNEAGDGRRGHSWIGARGRFYGTRQQVASGETCV